MARASRVALARLAERAALEDPGVAELDSGRSGLRATREGTESVAGVVCTAVAGGGRAIDLYVIAEPDDLHAMADRVRATVQESARAEGLEDLIDSVAVHVEDIVDPAERRLA